jgi:hypothetical protein
MKKIVFFITAFFLFGSALADDTSRKEKITAIVEAQGLQQMFQTQLNQSKATAEQYGRNIFNKIIKNVGPDDEKANPDLEAIFGRYLEKCSSMWSANELVEVWSKHYGQELSDQDLDQILTYYKSTAGKKDIAASQAAMNGFLNVMQTKGLQRMNVAVEELVGELKASLKK